MEEKKRKGKKRRERGERERKPHMCRDHMAFYFIYPYFCLASKASQLADGLGQAGPGTGQTGELEEKD